MLENLLNYAEYNGEMVFIDDVANGLDCNCFCPHCKEQLIAKNKGTHNKHHFAHKSAECKYAYQTMIHKLAKEIIAENLNSFIIPNYPEYSKELLRAIDISALFGTFVNAECEVYLGDIIPDIVLTDVNGRKLLVEIKVTHGVDDDKREKIKLKKLSCIEFDLSCKEFDLNCKEKKFNKKTLKNYLLNNNASWIYFYRSNEEFRDLIEDFKKNDKCEAILNKIDCDYGVLKLCSDNCEYFRGHCDLNNFCDYKVKNFEKNNKFDSYKIIRNENYVITEIIFTYLNKEQSIFFNKNCDETILMPDLLSEKIESNNKEIAKQDEIILVNGFQYIKDETKGTIKTIWKKRPRKQMLVMNDKNEIFEITASAYNKRKNNKFIEAIKVQKPSNKLVKVENFNKKIWKELIKVSQ